MGNEQKWFSRLRKLAVLIAVPLAVLLWSCYACSAYSDYTVTCWRAPQVVAIDADLSEWNTSSAVVLNSESQLVRDANQWTDPLDLSAEVFLMWDADNLYLAAVVRDDTPFMYREGFPPDWADSIVLFFSTDPEADPNRSSYDSTDFRLTLIIDDYLFNTGLDREMVADKRGIETRGDAGDEQILDGYEYAIAEIDGGYIFEAKIPLSNFSNDQIPVLVPADGVEIGFDLSMFDLDFPCPGIATARMAWTGSAEADSDPSKWGRLIFRGQIGGAAL
ncbi:MAG: hypothetical protein GXX08_12425 [Firmicutes bacterium]|nr:hypothetical protein [Bacillota bacterium]